MWRMMQRRWIKSVVIIHLLILIGLTVAGLPPVTGSDNSQSSRRLAPCQICRVMVNSFNSGIQKTANGHYTGGDAAWEEDNKKSYKNSELRLTEIQETLCSDVSIGKDHCHEFAVNNEDLLEQWWEESHRNAGQDLLSWLCINKLKVCCEENHFGPNCTPCPGFPDNICSGRGKCKGDGTRKGSGECSCETGYFGDLCDACAPLYFQKEEETGDITCSSCHQACKNGCQGPGAKNCELCKDGWEFNEDQECVDSNECLFEKKPCKRNEFCQNIVGSYNCLSCDTSCNGCFGDGSDMCEKCADGFTMKDKVCIDNSTWDRQSQMNTTRYLIYSGIALFSLIVFQKNAALASFIGIGFGVYVATTEYLLNEK